MKKKVCPSPILVSEICQEIIAHKSCPGITAEQVKSLIKGKKQNEKFPEIICAIKQTEYYERQGSINESMLSSIPKKEWTPIHYLFSIFS